jgi:hypothetical protein
MQNNREIVLEAVKQNGGALAYAAQPDEFHHLIYLNGEYGGEYTCGEICDPKDVEHLQLREENGDLDFENENSGEYSEYNSIECYNEESYFHLYGSDLNYTKLTICKAVKVGSSYEPTTKEKTIKKNSLVVNAPSSIQRDEGCVVLGGATNEKGMNGTYSLQTDQKFEAKNLFVFAVDVSNLLTNNTVVTKLYYIPESKQKSFVKDAIAYFKKIGDDKIADIMAEYEDKEFKDIYKNMLGKFTNDSSFQYMYGFAWLDDCELERTDFEGGSGSSKEAFLL